MRFIHTSDLHIGKLLEGWDLSEDTDYVLDQLVDIAVKEKADCVVIAGDVFDRSVASEDCLVKYDLLLKRLCIDHGIKVLAIAGNHDSGERLAANNLLLELSGLYYVVGRPTETIKKVTLKDEYGPVNFYLLPFFTPNDIKKFFNPEVSKYTDDSAFRDLMAHQEIDTSQRNVLVAHLFAAGFTPSGSEFGLSDVAGVGNIAIDRFKDFDYVALGHIHQPQQVSRPTLRYSGSLLKYKISEVKRQEKSVCVVDLGPKGDVKVETVPIKPLHPLREVTDSFDNLIKGAPDKDSFVFVHLTDQQMISNAASRLDSVFPHLVSLNYVNLTFANPDAPTEVAGISPLEMIQDFYRSRHGNTKDLSPEQLEVLKDILADIGKQTEEGK